MPRRGTTIARVHLFGSSARGSERDDSDIDLDVEAGHGFPLIDAGLFAERVKCAPKATSSIKAQSYGSSSSSP